MSSQSVAEDASPVSRADRALYAVESALLLAGGILILGIMLVAVANILGRKLFDLPVPGFVDWMEQAVPIIAFAGIAGCQRIGQHIRMDILVSRLRGRALWLFELLSSILMLLLVLGLLWGSWMHFDRSFDWNSPLWSRDSTIDINLPIWPVKLFVPVMLGLLAVRLSLQIWAYALALRSGAERPVAVPLIETVAEQAAAEARQVSGADPDDGGGGDTAMPGRDAR